MEETDTIAAWCVNNAVLTFGTIIENALAETVETGLGSNKRSERKYNLEQLLLPTFCLPKPQPKTKPQGNSTLAKILSMAGDSRSGVKVFRHVGLTQ